jgi:hypothetical protein
VTAERVQHSSKLTTSSLDSPTSGSPVISAGGIFLALRNTHEVSELSIMLK